MLVAHYGAGDGGRRVPHYAMKTITHSAPEFANHEQDVIRQSFSAGNHTWIKHSVPAELGPDAVNTLRRQRMERNRLSEPLTRQTWTKMTQTWRGGPTQEFEYMRDEFDRRQAAEREARLSGIEKREKIANHDWRHASQERRLKYEAMVADSGQKEKYPYLGGDKDEEFQVASKSWLRDGRRSVRRARDAQAKDMTPPVSDQAFLGGKGRGLEDDSKGSRMTLPMTVQRLQRRVGLDWEGTTVVVNATDQDLVQIAFHMATVDSEKGVMAYMNILAKDVDLIGSLGLRKVSQLWGMKRDFAADLTATSGSDTPDEVSLEHTWIFFLLMPKWVRMRPTDAYYTVHPRSQGSTFRMSTAGSSVLVSLGTAAVDHADPPRPKETPRARGPRERRLRESAAPRDQEQGLLALSLIERAVSALSSVQELPGTLE